MYLKITYILLHSFEEYIHMCVCKQYTHASKQRSDVIKTTCLGSVPMAVPPACLYKQNSQLWHNTHSSSPKKAKTTLLAHWECCKTKLQSFGPCYRERSGSYPHGWLLMRFLLCPYLAERGELMWAVRQLCVLVGVHIKGGGYKVSCVISGRDKIPLSQPLWGYAEGIYYGILKHNDGAVFAGPWESG